MELILIEPQYLKPIILSGLGGLVLSFINLVQDLQKEPSNRITKDLVYIFTFVFWPLVSCILSYIYLDSGNKITSFLAFHIGLTTPALVQSLLATSPIVNHTPQEAEE